MSGNKSLKLDRGLVVSNPIKITPAGVSSKGGLDPQEVRFSILLWDKLVWPINERFKIATDPESQFLVDAGILTREEYTPLAPEMMDAAAVGRVLSQMQIGVLKKLSAIEPGKWSLAEGESSFLDYTSNYRTYKGFSYILNKAIPVPASDTPFADVLEFKGRRQDELTNLRLEIESFAQKIAASGDNEAALKSAILEIEKACIAVLKVSKETSFPLKLTTFSPEYNLDITKILGGLLSSAGLMQMGLPTLSSILLGMGVALNSDMVSIRVNGNISVRKTEDTLHPFRYVSSFTNELFK